MIQIFLHLLETEEDRQKLERLYLAYRQTMFYVAHRILKNHHESEDAVHQAFLRVIDNIHRINESACHKTRALLVVITENIAIDMYRKRKRENTVSYDALEIYLSDDVSFEDEAMDEVSAAILNLPVNDSVVLRLKYSQGFSNAQIAEILDITQDNVRQRISRAKRKLRELLQEGESHA